MNLSDFLATWRGTKKFNNFLLIAVFVQALALLVLAFAMSASKSVVTMHVPNLSKEAKVGHNFATTSYLEAWALYITQALGNVTPESVQFIREVVSPVLHPKVYDSVMDALEKQVAEIRNNNVSLTFEPRKIFREKSSNKVFVFGTSLMDAANLVRKRSPRTYELQFEILNYMPALIHIDTYAGEPRTKEYLEELERSGKSIK